MDKLIRFFSCFEEFSRNAAFYISEKINKKAGERGFASIVLAGGSTPRLTYSAMADCDLPWQDTHFFFGDERCVELDSKMSNFNMAYMTLFSKTKVISKNIHIMRGNLKNSESAAMEYEEDIKEFFKKTGKSCFDLMILGIGTDGHTASLFPGSEQIGERKRWVLPAEAPRGIKPEGRITLTLPLINRTEEIIFLVSGSKKLDVVDKVFRGKQEVLKKYPAAMVRAQKAICWFVCEEGL